MNRLILCLLAVTALFACKQTKTTDNRFAALLQQPPYKTYTDSISRFPKKGSLYLSRGILLLQNQQPEASLYDMEKAWQYEPTDMNAWYYGSTLINLQRYDSAIRHLETASRSFANNLDIKERLAYAYDQQKQPQKAIAVYDDILQRDSTAFRIWAAKAYLLRDAGKNAGALEAFETSYRLNPTTTVGDEIAFMYAETRDPRTVPFCDGMIRLDSTKSSVKPYYFKGLYYKNTNRIPEALAMFDYCMKEDYTFADPFLEKGEILYNQSKFEEALKLFQLTKTNNNMYADAYYWTGKCFEALEQKEEAALEYERALALDKDFTEAKEGLERMKK